MSKFGTCVKINMGKGMKFGAAVKECNKTVKGSGSGSNDNKTPAKAGAKAKQFPIKKK